MRICHYNRDEKCSYRYIPSENHIDHFYRCCPWLWEKNCLWCSMNLHRNPYRSGNTLLFQSMGSVRFFFFYVCESLLCSPIIWSRTQKNSYTEYYYYIVILHSHVKKIGHWGVTIHSFSRCIDLETWIFESLISDSNRFKMQRIERIVISIAIQCFQNIYILNYYKHERMETLNSVRASHLSFTHALHY